MAFDDINLGTSPTGAGGDSVRAAFEKTNSNFQAMLDQLDQRATAQLEREKRFSRLVESLHGGLPALRADLRGQSYAMKAEGVLLPVEYPDLFSLTRPGPTTVWDAQGNLVTVPSGQPALGPDGQQIVAFPVTNYFRSSTTLRYWEAQGATITDASEPVPFVDGGMADVLTANAGNSLHGMRSTVYVNQGNETRYTYIVKPSNIKRVGWGRYAVDDANLIVFDFESVSVVQDGNGFVNGAIVALREGWFKISFTVIAGTTTTAYLPRFYFLPPTKAGSYDGTGSSWETQGNESLAFFFLQATDGDVDLPLIYTTNSQQTSAADLCKTQPVFGDRYNADRGALFFDYDTLSSPNWGSARILQNNPANSNSSIFITGTLFRIYGRDGSFFANGRDYTGRHKVMISWEESGTSIFVDGEQIYSGAGRMPLSVQEFQFFNLNGSNVAAGYVRQFWLSDQPVTEQRGVELTTL